MSQDKRVQRTYAALEKALMTLIKKKRLEQITTSELCREAGINRNTFYAHFATPNDVFDHIFKREIERISNYFLSATLTEKEESALSFNYQEYLTHLCILLKEKRDNVEALTSSKADLTYITDIWRSFQDQQVEIWLKNPNNRLGREDLLFLNDFVMSAAQYTILQWIYSGFATPPEVIGRKLATLVEAVLKDCMFKEEL